MKSRPAPCLDRALTSRPPQSDLQTHPRLCGLPSHSSADIRRADVAMSVSEFLAEIEQRAESSSRQERLRLHSAVRDSLCPRPCRPEASPRASARPASAQRERRLCLRASAPCAPHLVTAAESCRLLGAHMCSRCGNKRAAFPGNLPLEAGAAADTNLFLRLLQRRAEAGEAGREPPKALAPSKRSTVAPDGASWTFFSDLADLDRKLAAGRVPRRPRAGSPEARKRSVLETHCPAFVSCRKALLSPQPRTKLFYEPPLLPLEQQKVKNGFFAGHESDYSLAERLPDNLLPSDIAEEVEDFFSKDVEAL